MWHQNYEEKQESKRWYHDKPFHLQLHFLFRTLTADDNSIHNHGHPGSYNTSLHLSMHQQRQQWLVIMNNNLFKTFKTKTDY